MSLQNLNVEVTHTNIDVKTLPNYFVSLSGSSTTHCFAKYDRCLIDVSTHNVTAPN